MQSVDHLIEERSHCVYLGYIVAVSLPLHNLDWILTFSSFRFCFPCAVFKVRSRLPQPFGPLQLRGCGTVVSSPLVEPLGSPSVRPRLRRPFAFASELLKVLHFFRSFKTIQCFNQEFQSDSRPFGLNRILCRLVVSVPLFLTSTLFSLH